MQIPNAETIEGAVDNVLRLDGRISNDEIRELHLAVGAAAAAKMHVAFPLSEDFKCGYVLALEVARMTVATSSEVNVHGADSKKIL